MSTRFQSIYQHGFARIAACTPKVSIADPIENASHIAELVKEAEERHVAVAVFPELCLSAYAIDDLLQQDVLLDGVIDGLEILLHRTRDTQVVYAIGAPLAVDGRLYNCAIVIQAGAVLGVVPKSFLPNYSEFYERRHFASGVGVVDETIDLGRLGEAPFGVDLMFEATGEFAPKGLRVHVEICEDVWTAIPPSSLGALAGATVLLNLSASNITIGKGEARRMLCTSQSSRCIAAYAYSAAGGGESTNDLSWDGQAIICENGDLLAESPRFEPGGRMIVSDIDLDRLRHDRMRVVTFNDSREANQTMPFRVVQYPFDARRLAMLGDIGFERQIDRFPFVPSNPLRLDEDCFEGYNIQVDGLVQRLRSSGIDKVVLGVSGGLDSTQALIVAARAMDLMGLPRTNILGFSMPGFATSARTRTNALALMNAFGITADEIDITETARLMLRTMGHPAGDGEAVYDTTFENVQAGLRTDYLFRKANQLGAIVIGTGDMSELALGWCTYGVGDQMSHYGVNAGVPKTLIQYFVRWVVRQGLFPAASDILLSILDTAISPELVPVAAGAEIQSSESKIGPYALQDFNLYYLVRRGYLPSKVAFLAWQAWGKGLGAWPAGFPDEAKADIDIGEIRKWIEVFLKRFFGFSQFKRTAMPNGPKVSSGGSLSPRGDWRAPSDSSAKPWLRNLQEVPETLVPDGPAHDRSLRTRLTAAVKGLVLVDAAVADAFFGEMGITPSRRTSWLDRGIDANSDAALLGLAQDLLKRLGHPDDARLLAPEGLLSISALDAIVDRKIPDLRIERTS